MRRHGVARPEVDDLERARDDDLRDPLRPAAVSRSGPAEKTPPQSSSVSSLVVTSTTPSMRPASTIASIACPPDPTAWKTIVSKPFASSAAWMRWTHGVVIPNIVSATRGVSPAGAVPSPRTIPAIAAAALERTLRETRLRPWTSVTE